MSVRELEYRTKPCLARFEAMGFTIGVLPTKPDLVLGEEVPITDPVIFFLLAERREIAFRDLGFMLPENNGGTADDEYGVFHRTVDYGTGMDMFFDYIVKLRDKLEED